MSTAKKFVGEFKMSKQAFYFAPLVEVDDLEQQSIYVEPVGFYDTVKWASNGLKLNIY